MALCWCKRDVICKELFCTTESVCWYQVAHHAKAHQPMCAHCFVSAEFVTSNHLPKLTLLHKNLYDLLVPGILEHVIHYASERFLIAECLRYGSKTVIQRLVPKFHLVAQEELYALLESARNLQAPSLLKLVDVIPMFRYELSYAQVMKKEPCGLLAYGTLHTQDIFEDCRDLVRTLDCQELTLHEDAALYLAAETGQTQCVENLMTQRSHPPQTDGLALQIASRFGLVNLTQFLLTNKADLHAKQDIAIRLASQYGQVKLVSFLIEEKANVHAMNDEAIQFSSQNGHTEVVQILLQAGANIHAEDDYAIRWASECGHVGVVQILLEAKADVHAKENDAIQSAAQQGHTEVVQILLQAKANIHAGDDCAIRRASEHGHLGVVQTLLQAKANVNAGNTPAIRWASYNGHVEVVQILLEAKANSHAQG